MKDEHQGVIDAWNTLLFDKFCRFRSLLTDGLAVHGRELAARHPPPRGGRVLDVGSGFGDTTRALAELVGPAGSALGIDCAERFIALAEREVRELGPENARFVVGDVQLADLGGPYDYVFSRFGTMFFVLPGAALRNLRRALVPGGAAHFVVWRRREDNPWLFAAEECVKRIVPVVSHEETSQVHCGPGPFSMASADLVSELLRASGYDRICFERFDADVCIGRDRAEAVEFALALGPAGEILRLAADRAQSLEGEVRAALTQALAPFERADGIWAPSSTWLISARNPT